MRKRRILIFADYYYPGFRAGGPIRSLQELIQSLGDQFEFYVITRCHDFHDETPYNVPLSQPVVQGKATVYYLTGSWQVCYHIVRLIQKIQPNLIYLNSFFTEVYSFFPVLLAKFWLRKKIKILLAPRGSLAPGALSLKARKKELFLKIANFLKLYDHVAWHVTSLEEAENIRAIFPQAKKIYTIPNLKIIQLGNLSVMTKSSGDLKLIFLSRISAKKNLAYALQLLQPITSGNIIFDIYGVAEDPRYL